MKKILITGGNGNIAKIIVRNLGENYKISNPSRNELNILEPQEIDEYLKNQNFDILVHTAIKGGRRTKEETGEVTHVNLIMFENLMIHAEKFKMIINLDSAAIYDRSTDIKNRSEDELYTIPSDYYGFSKYVIYQRSLAFPHLVNLRIFNIYHNEEEPDRFIKSCFLSKQNNSKITIFEDKYFDFFHEFDFAKVVDYYFKNVSILPNLPKTLNLCYKDKLKLSQIAKFIIGDENQIIINKTHSDNNYCGNPTLLFSLGLNINSNFKDSLNFF